MGLIDKITESDKEILVTLTGALICIN